MVLKIQVTKVNFRQRFICELSDMFYNVIESYIWLSALGATHQAAASIVPLRFFSSWEVAWRLSVSIATPRLRMGHFQKVLKLYHSLRMILSSPCTCLSASSTVSFLGDLNCLEARLR